MRWVSISACCSPPCSRSAVFWQASAVPCNCPRTRRQLGMDLAIIADVFVVVVVGGLGSLPGAFVAAGIISLVKAWCIGHGRSHAVRRRHRVQQTDAGRRVHRDGAGAGVENPNGLFGKPLTHAARRCRASASGSRAGRRSLIALAIALVVLVLPTPQWAGDYTLVLAIDVIVFALFAASLGLVIGNGGMGSFGHAAYFGLGAYGAALLAKAGYGLIVACLGGVGAGSAGGVAVRLVQRATLGTCMAMLTLAFAQITCGQSFSVGCRDRWQQRHGRYLAAGRWLSPSVDFYWLVLLVCSATLLCAWLVFTPLGYAVCASRDAPVKAAAIGLVATWFCNGHGSPLPAPSPGGRALYASRRQHFARRDGHSALGRCAGDGVARRYQHAARPDHRGGRVYLAAGHAGPLDRVLARGARVTILLLVVLFPRGIAGTIAAWRSRRAAA